MARIRKGVSAVIWIKSDHQKKYLILKRKLHWKGYEFLKGGLKKGENSLKAIIREIKEETGKISGSYNISRTKFRYQFAYQKPIIHDLQVWDGAKNIVYVVEFLSPKIRIDKKEHSGFKWVDKKKALNLLTWPEQKNIIRRIK